MHFVGEALQLTLCQRCPPTSPWPKALGQGLRPRLWPTTLAQCFGPKPWPKVLAQGNGPRPWARALAQGFGPRPWDKTLAQILGPKPRAKAVAQGLGPRPWTHRPPTQTLTSTLQKGKCRIRTWPPRGVTLARGQPQILHFMVMANPQILHFKRETVEFRQGLGTTPKFYTSKEKV